MQKNEKIPISRSPAVHLVLVLLLGLIVYSNTFSVPFTWDDDRFIVSSPSVRDASYPLESLKRDGETYRLMTMRPLGMATFALNYRLSGFHAPGFHAFNLLVHLLNAVLVYVLVALSFKTPFLRSTLVRKNADIAALIAALLFVSHPLQTEAVTYIFQRLASLATLAYLVSLVLYLQARLIWQEREQNKDVRKGSVRTVAGGSPFGWYVAALAAAAMGMLVKEIAITLPVMITAYELCFFEKRSVKQTLGLVPFWLVALIIPFRYLFSLSHSMEAATRGYGSLAHGRLDYLLTQFRVIATYLRLLIWPTHQNIDYDYPLFHSFVNSEVILSFLLLALLGGIGAYWYRRSTTGERVWRFAAFGIFWFFATLSIESSVIPLQLLICEYRMYLPSIGLVLTTSTGLVILLNRATKPAAYVLGAIVMLAIVLLATTAYFRNALWADPVGFWEQTTQESPRKFVPSYNRAVALSRQGRVQDAVNELQRTLAGAPQYLDAYELLAELQYKQGDYGGAMKTTQAALALRPDSDGLHTQLGILCDVQGRIPEAIEEFKTALRISPDSARPRDELGVAYARQQRYAEAEAEFRAVLTKNPEYLPSRINLGMLYDEKGRYQDAIEEFTRALRIEPKSAEVHYNIGIVHARLKRYDAAEQEFRKAILLKPEYAAAKEALDRAIMTQREDSRYK